MKLYYAIIIPSFSKTGISHFVPYKGSLYCVATLLKRYKYLVEFYVTMK